MRSGRPLNLCVVQFHNLCRTLAADQRLDVFGPSRQGDALLRLVAGAIVDSGNTGLVATDVVQNRLDDVCAVPNSAMRVAIVRRRSWITQGSSL
jgi:hypothetical protein